MWNFPLWEDAIEMIEEKRLKKRKKKWGYKRKELMREKVCKNRSLEPVPIRVFDNFQFIRNNIGGGDGLELSTHFRSFSFEREREMEGKQRRRGEEKRKTRSRRVRLTFSIGELFAHGRRYTGMLLPRKSLQSLLVGKLIDQTIAHPSPFFHSSPACSGVSC